MEIKLVTLMRWRRESLERVVASLSHNRDTLAEMPDDADVRRLREKATICLLKVQELRAEMEELIENLEANHE
jgi:hypothetical protein